MVLVLQKEYCRIKEIPMFALERCLCGKITKDTAKEHLTNCKVCNRSWCK